MPPLNLSTLTDLRTRAYLYRVLLAVGLFIAVPYGLITQQELDYWGMVASTVLGTGTATYNTPRPSKRKNEAQATLMAAHVAGHAALARGGIVPGPASVTLDRPEVVVKLDGAAIHKALLEHKRNLGRDLGL